MGRRALPKIDANLDLSRHLLTLGDLIPPFDPCQCFGRTAPLEIEVGSGKGLFLQAASARLPQRDFLGLEIGAKYARFAAARLAQKQRENAKLICGDAVRFLREFLPNESVVAIHVYFPDPWWKKRHRKRRVMTAGLVADAERVLRSGGSLHFWTDVEEYFLATMELVTACTNLAGPVPVAESSPEHDLDYRTHFERRTRLNGEVVYRAEFHKR